MRNFCRLIFSRYAISALMILIDIVLLLVLVFEASLYSYLVFFVAVFLNAIVMIAIINADVNPEYKVSWIAVISLLPFFGALLCIIFYQRRMTKKDIRLGEDILKKLTSGDRNHARFSELSKLDSTASGRAMAIMRDDPLAEVYSATDAEYFPSGESMYEAMLLDIASAERYIFLEYFIIKEGEMWSGIYELLKEKAKAGVKVRLLYDDIGCMRTLHPRFDRSVREDGIECIRFAKVTPRLSTVHNNRDHRKICVVDGRVAYTGGINIADEYINKKVRFGHWKDGGVRISGDAVLGFVKLFLQNWHFNKGATGEVDEFINVSPISCDRTERDEFFIPFGSGPAPIYPRSVGKEVFLNTINQAQRYVYISTPYLIIDFDLTESLRNAALRGVDVRIITPAIADKKLVKIMTKSAYPYLIEAGVKIYEYTPGFIHEKLVVSDDLYTVIGSINFDYRSLAHHFECAVWMYSCPMAEKARDGYMETVSKSKLMDPPSYRLSFSEWALKNLVRLIAPLL